MEEQKQPIKGRGAQLNVTNKYLENEYVLENFEGIDELPDENPTTSFYNETPKKVVNKIISPDLPFEYSMNPYQGCEHGCSYCYARNTHQYYGFSAGMDFEQKIIVKKNAPAVLEKQLQNKNWKVHPIMLAGNTDCYQPIERKKQITRQLLQVLLKYKHPVSIITKNALILRDLDILTELAKLNLIQVAISITSLDEELRRKMEPRTSSGLNRIKTIQKLSDSGIPTMVMMAPIIPGLNSNEIPEILKQSAKAGALTASNTMIRLNGEIGAIFTNWIETNFPLRAEKVLNLIKEVNNGGLNSSSYGDRMRGTGNIATSIHQLFAINKKKYFNNRQMPHLDCSIFTNTDQLSLF